MQPKSIILFFYGYILFFRRQISIIMPTYNVEQYIARAIESCINQTFKDIEIIVVDDCGSDKSYRYS